jgi:hypothetical protein
MSKPENYYGQKAMARTLTEIKKCALEQKLSCVHQPLIEIQVENIILDELHLMLRVTGEINITLHDLDNLYEFQLQAKIFSKERHLHHPPPHPTPPQDLIF